MSERMAETILGAIVAVIAVGFFVFAAAQAREGAGGTAGPTYFARFQNVSGVAPGSDVRVSGVKVGIVRDVEIDPATYMAKLSLTVAPEVQLLDESVARISSDGLLGGAFVSIEPTGLEPLAPGSEIVNTQGAVDFLTLLASAAQNLGSDNSNAASEAAE
jgi:phospholipid/cholesterol/gamma-HCH transport system substrate-binding protein